MYNVDIIIAIPEKLNGGTDGMKPELQDQEVLAMYDVRGIQSYIEWIAAGACGVIAAGTSPHIAVAIVAAGCTLLIYSSHSAAPDLILVYSGAHDHSGSRNNGITVLLINQSLDSVSTCAQNGNK